MSALAARNRYVDSLDHIDSAYGKIKGMVGRGGALTFPDVYKLTEGLFLNSWTYWEAFLRDVLWNDLAADSNGALLRDMAIKGKRTNGPYRLAELILNHPDAPDKFVDWADYGTVKKRATALLGAGHRFTTPPPQLGDIEKLKRIRNAIAHKSDRAWDSFMSLATSPPFSLTGVQTRGLTPGRFLYAHTWNGVTVMDYASTSLRQAALAIAP
jgi:hypothetical protein